MTNHVKDRHVLAAAVGARASHVVTANIKDFPVRSRPAGIVVVRPDALLLSMLAGDRDNVLRALASMARRHRRPTQTPAELAKLIDAGVHAPRFGRRLLETLQEDGVAGH